MPVSPKIIELRKILAERYPQQTDFGSLSLPTGWTPLDSLLGGGLPKGAITQLLIPKISSGGATVLHQVIATMQEASQYVALIDSTDCFEPAAEEQPLLLWIRCHNLLQALKAADLVLRDGNLSLVILDFKENLEKELRKVRESTWYRFQRIIEENRNALLTITRHPIVASAQVTVTATHQLCLDDLSTQRTDLLQLISLEIIRSRIHRERQYA